MTNQPDKPAEDASQSNKDSVEPLQPLGKQPSEDDGSIIPPAEDGPEISGPLRPAEDVALRSKIVDIAREVVAQYENQVVTKCSLSDEQIDQIMQLFEADKQAAVERARVTGKIEGLSEYARLDQESIRKQTRFMKVDSRDVLNKVADCYKELECLAALKQLHKGVE